jgi:hypothetical protein
VYSSRGAGRGQPRLEPIDGDDARDGGGDEK